jgi:transcriptional regulator with XRE-family HTH domain
VHARAGRGCAVANLWVECDELCRLGGEVESRKGARNWSQDELSAKSGVSRRSIAIYEAGRTLPYDDTLEKLRYTFEAAGVRFHFVGMVGQGISFHSGRENSS